MTLWSAHATWYGHRMTHWLGYLGAVALVCVGVRFNAPDEPAEPPPAPVVVAAPAAPPAPAVDPSMPAPAQAPSGG